MNNNYQIDNDEEILYDTLSNRIPQNQYMSQEGSLMYQIYKIAKECDINVSDNPTVIGVIERMGNRIKDLKSCLVDYIVLKDKQNPLDELRG